MLVSGRVHFVYLFFSIETRGVSKCSDDELGMMDDIEDACNSCLHPQHPSKV